MLLVLEQNAQLTGYNSTGAGTMLVVTTGFMGTEALTPQLQIMLAVGHDALAIKHYR